jgi:Tol biopolymer transport system component
MNAPRDVDLFLRAHFEVTADHTVADGQVDAILATTAGRRQQPAWLASLRSLPMSTTTRTLGRPMSAPAWALLVILALLIAIAAVGLTVGGWRLAPAPIVNGPIVFGRFDASVDDTVIHIARPDGSDMHVVLPGANECPQFSPDGRQIAVAMKVVNVDGTDPRVFDNTVGNVTLGCSTWSPDGQRLAVEGWNETDLTANGIYLVNASDGRDVVRLTTNGQGHNDIPGDFSPDGRQLAYLHSVSDTIATLWVVEVATGVARQVVTTQVGYGPTWSPDGDWILIDGGDHFLVVRPDGTDGHTLRVPAEVGWVGDPQYSPDGTRILFSMALDGSDKNDIYTMKVDGTDLAQMTATPNDNEYFTDWGIDPR